jgi:hypothetical protein
MFVCFRAAEKYVMQKPTTLPIDHSTLVKDRWHKHRLWPVQVNEAGPHLYNNVKKKLFRIHCFAMKYGPTNDNLFAAHKFRHEISISIEKTDLWSPTVLLIEQSRRRMMHITVFTQMVFCIIKSLGNRCWK